MLRTYRDREKIDCVQIDHSIFERRPESPDSDFDVDDEDIFSGF